VGVLKGVLFGRPVVHPLKSAAITIGRGTECHVILADQNASRLHCQIIQNDKGFVLRDLASRIGTRVNGQPVKEQVLRDGDILQIGEDTLTFSNQTGPGATPGGASPSGRVPTQTRLAVPPAGASKTAGIPARQTGTVPVAGAAKTATGTQPVRTAPPPKTAGMPVLDLSPVGPPAPKAPGGSKISTVLPAAPPQKTTGRVPTVTQPAKSTERVPVVTQPPKSTGRLPAVIPGQKTTGRIPTVAPGEPGRSATGTRPAATGRTTSGIPRLDRGPGGTTARLRTGTGSIRQTGYTSARIHKGKSGLPAKYKMIAVLAILGLGGIISLLYFIWKGQVNPEEVKKELKEKIIALGKLSDEEIYKKDKVMEELLANPLYKSYALQMYNEISKVHDKVHELAQEQMAADKDVKPFLMKYESLQGQPEKLKDKEAINALYDEAKAKADRFSSTAYKPKLDAIVKELKLLLESLGTDSWLKYIYAKRAEWKKLREEHAFAKTLKSINEFGTKWKEASTPDLAASLNEERDNSKRQAVSFADKLGKDAQATADTDAAGALKQIKDAKPELEGFPEAIEKLDQAIKAVEKKAAAK
jgi:pSer/pThr/pTyr-binding forkhead associated (FHA) protein